MTALIIIAIAITLFFVFAKIGQATEIQKARSIKDIVMSINFGRVHPYRTGMKLDEVKYVVHRLHPNAAEIDRALGMYKLIGRVPFVTIPRFYNDYIEKVSLGLNSNNVVYSINIDIKDFDKNLTELARELSIKFGEPTSVSGNFIVWKDGHMTISISDNGSVSVIDGKLMGW